MSADERIEICQKGLEQFSNEYPDRIKNFLEEKPTGEMRGYVVMDLVFEDILVNIDVRPAYQCPTIPPLFIHVDLEEEGQRIFVVMFRRPRSRPTFTEFRVFQALFAKDIVESRHEYITRTRRIPKLPCSQKNQ